MSVLPANPGGRGRAPAGIVAGDDRDADAGEDGRRAVVRMIVQAGKEVPTHTAKGELVVQCLEGKIAFTACGKTHDLETGHLLHLSAGEPHALRGIEDGSLLTVLPPGR